MQALCPAPFQEPLTLCSPFPLPISQPNCHNGQTATGSPKPPCVGKSACSWARILHLAPKQAWLCSEGQHIPPPPCSPPPAPLFAFQVDAEEKAETAPLPTASSKSHLGSGGAERGVRWEHSTVPVSLGSPGDTVESERCPGAPLLPPPCREGFHPSQLKAQEESGLRSCSAPHLPLRGKLHGAAGPSPPELHKAATPGEEETGGKYPPPSKAQSPEGFKNPHPEQPQRWW